MNTSTQQLVELPADDASQTFEALGYLDGYDAVNDDDYAFLAWRETDRSSGDWRVRIKARGLSGVVFEPAQMRGPARAADARGLPWFTWGAGIEPGAGDPRQVEYRVHVAQGKPSEIEIVLVTRRFDHSAQPAQSLRFAWPDAA